VMCIFSTGIHCSFAKGRNRAIRSPSSALISAGMSMAVKSRKTQ